MSAKRFQEVWLAGAAAVFVLSLAVFMGAQSSSPSPQVTAGVNGQSQLTAFQGWPLIVNLSVVHPSLWDFSEQSTPILIASTSGRWADALRPMVSDISGNHQSWPLQLVAVSPGSLTLDGTTAGRLAWTLSPSFTASLTPGTYLISGVLNTTPLATTTAWKGIATSSPAVVTVGPEPSPLTSSQLEQKYISLADYHYLIGNSIQATADLNALEQQLPASIAAASAKAQLLELTGQTAAAIHAYDKALGMVFQQHPNAPEPPITLLSEQHRLIAGEISASGKVGKPQIAISTLGTGLQSPGVFYVDLNISNTGTGTAGEIALQKFVFRTLSGSGSVSLNVTLTPLPLRQELLRPSTSGTQRVYLNVPATVLRFSMAERGTVTDIVGTAYGFAAAQALIP